jgi:hypothetical protein
MLSLPQVTLYLRKIAFYLSRSMLALAMLRPVVYYSLLGGFTGGIGGVSNTGGNFLSPLISGNPIGSGLGCGCGGWIGF